MVEPIGHLWAAFSPASGETALVNDETASVLEVLSLGPANTESVCKHLAADSGVAAGTLTEIIETCWPRLIDAGLVHELRLDSTSAQ